MASRIFALLVWAAVAASLAYWGLRWIARPVSVPPNATPVTLQSGSQGDLRRLLVGPVKASDAQQGDTSAGAALAARIKLIGIVAPKREGDGTGVALLSLDGKPPKAVRIGAMIDGDMTLQSLTQRSAAIGPAHGPAVTTLDLPLLPPPATGALPPPQGVTVSGTAQVANQARAAGTTQAAAPMAPPATPPEAANDDEPSRAHRPHPGL
jgi:general secretion pathway protein C